MGGCGGAEDLLGVDMDEAAGVSSGAGVLLKIEANLSLAGGWGAGLAGVCEAALVSSAASSPLEVPAGGIALPVA